MSVIKSRRFLVALTMAVVFSMVCSVVGTIAFSREALAAPEAPSSITVTRRSGDYWSMGYVGTSPVGWTLMCGTPKSGNNPPVGGTYDVEEFPGSSTALHKLKVCYYYLRVDTDAVPPTQAFADMMRRTQPNEYGAGVSPTSSAARGILYHYLLGYLCPTVPYNPDVVHTICAHEGCLDIENALREELEDYVNRALTYYNQHDADRVDVDDCVTIAYLPAAGVQNMFISKYMAPNTGNLVVRKWLDI